jgi:hypothetical protein
MATESATTVKKEIFSHMTHDDDDDEELNLTRGKKGEKAKERKCVARKGLADRSFSLRRLRRTHTTLVEEKHEDTKKVMLFPGEIWFSRIFFLFRCEPASDVLGKVVGMGDVCCLI